MASKVVLITGCSNGGIGFHLCQEFARRGCSVYATSRTLRSMNGFEPNLQIRTKELDICNEEAVNHVVRDVFSETGKIDIVVSNAGILASGAVLDVAQEHVQRTFDTNTFGTLRLARAAVPYMIKRQSGLFLVVGSIGATVSTPWVGVYAASKAALHAITDSLAMECSPFGVNVMLLIPGAVKTNVVANASALYRQPEGSLWKEYSSAIIQRMALSQSPTIVVPTEVFAKQVVDQAMKPTPPRSMYAGGSVFIWRIVAYLPRWFALWFAWRLFGKTTLPV